MSTVERNTPQTQSVNSEQQFTAGHDGRNRRDSDRGLSSRGSRHSFNNHNWTENQPKSNGQFTKADFEAEVAKLQSGWKSGDNGEGEAKSGDRQQKPLEAFPVIAETLNPFWPAPEKGLPVTQGVSFPPEKAEQIARILVDRMEMVTVGRIPGDKTGFHLTLNKASYGLSGVSVSLSSGALVVGLEGINDPVSQALAIAGQSLVRELQKHYPNRAIKIVALSDAEAAERATTDGIKEGEPARPVSF
jgi:hypothetical protein